jgi:hypothetical protein
MAKHDRCVICDYSEAEGSSIGGVGPGHNGRVRRHGPNEYCDVCLAAVGMTLADYAAEDEPAKNE